MLVKERVQREEFVFVLAVVVHLVAGFTETRSSLQVLLERDRETKGKEVIWMRFQCVESGPCPDPKTN